MPDKNINILFPCTRNSAHNIVAEATLNKLGKGRVKDFLAGSDPRENQQTTPMALEISKTTGIPTGGVRSKHWDVFYPDRSAVRGTNERKAEAFRQTLHAITKRLSLLVNRSVASNVRMMLETHARGLATA